MAEKLGTRDVYGVELAKLGEINKDIVVLTGDLAGSTKVSKFGKTFPNRFFNLGVAEQDMMRMAAGLAAAGKSHLSALLLFLPLAGPGNK